jgi:hypothetical protein
MMGRSYKAGTKTTGREEFGKALSQGVAQAEKQMTPAVATCLTAVTIVDVLALSSPS